MSTTTKDKVTISPVPGATSPAPAEKPRRVPLRRIAAKLQAHLRLRAGGVVKFAAASERLDDAIALGLPVGEDIRLPDGRTVQVHDQFAQHNEAGGYKIFPRYKVEEITEAKRASRARRQGRKEAPGA